MLTFHSDPAKKQARIDRAKRHVEQDRLMSGTYNDGNGHGCSVGCDAMDIDPENSENPHAIVSGYDGTPEWLEHLRDVIFEGLPSDNRAGWHVALAEAIPVGVDIAPVRHRLAAWILSADGPMTEGINHETVRESIETIRQMHERAGRGEETIESAAWSAAKSAAGSAARSAGYSVRSAAYTAACSAACSAAWSAESAALSAGYSVRSDAYSAACFAGSAESAAFIRIADKVLELLRAAT